MSQIENVVQKQRKYFNSNSTKPLSFRLEQLKKLKKIVTENQDAISEALFKDLKKSKLEAHMTETALVLEEIDVAIKNLSSWAKPKKVSTPISLKPGTSEVIFEPLGVTLVISPWNYPFQLALAPAIGAIAAGNTVILKPSEISSNTEKLLEQLINSNFDEEYIHVVVGGKEETQKILAQKFDFIFFTGSTQVGKVIMKAAAEYLTPVCLELGGKSPCIVDETANLEVAARRIVWGKFLNAGQTCVAPDYIYVHESLKADLVTLLKKNIREFYGENESKSADFGKIISLNHFDRLSKLISGSKILYGGDQKREEQFISPTLLEVQSWDEPVMKEEIFGPILPLLTYKNLDDVLSLIKSKDRPLALYIFSTNTQFSEKVISDVSFGGGCVNDCIIHVASAELPFGGVGASGMGRYHGHYSFETFSHQKTIIRKSNFLDLNVRYPPYTEKKANLLLKIR